MWPGSTLKPSSSWPTTQDNPGDTFFVATCNHAIKDLATGQSTKTTLYQLLGDQVEVVEKRVNYDM